MTSYIKDQHDNCARELANARKGCLWPKVALGLVGLVAYGAVLDSRMGTPQKTYAIDVNKDGTKDIVQTFSIGVPAVYFVSADGTTRRAHPSEYDAQSVQNSMDTLDKLVNE